MGTLNTIVGGRNITIVQGFGHTPWSTGAGAWMYAYGRQFCLDGMTHPGVDIGGTDGETLYSPVDGRVIIAGGVGVYTDARYGSRPGTGELAIELETGAIVILGHCSLISVARGARVRDGQIVGRMGVYNGPHVHVEYRIPSRECPAGYRIVDPVTYIGGRNTPGDPAPPADPGDPNNPDPLNPPPGTAAPIFSDGWKGIAERVDYAMQIRPWSSGPMLDVAGQNLKGITARGLAVAAGAILVMAAIRRGQ